MTAASYEPALGVELTRVRHDTLGTGKIVAYRGEEKAFVLFDEADGADGWFDVDDLRVIR